MLFQICEHRAQRGTVEQPAAAHHGRDPLGVLDVIQGVGIERSEKRPGTAPSL
jgi:hypothetical protein